MAFKPTMTLEPVEVDDGRLTGMAVSRCALLTEYSLRTGISLALGAQNAAGIQLIISLKCSS